MVTFGIPVDHGGYISSLSTAPDRYTNERCTHCYHVSGNLFACTECELALYCSEACRDRDLQEHVKLCHRFTEFRDENRPSPAHRRVVVFPSDKLCPRLEWAKVDEKRWTVTVGPEAGNGPEVEHKVEAEAEAGAEAEEDESEGKSKDEQKVEAKAEVAPQTEAGAEARVGEADASNKPEAEPGAVQEAETETESKVDPEAESGVKPEPEAGVEPQIGEAESSTKPERADPEPGAGDETKAESSVKPRADSAAEPGTDPETELPTTAEAGFATQPNARAETADTKGHNRPAIEQICVNMSISLRTRMVGHAINLACTRPRASPQEGWNKSIASTAPPGHMCVWFGTYVAYAWSPRTKRGRPEKEGGEPSVADEGRRVESGTREALVEVDDVVDFSPRDFQHLLDYFHHHHFNPVIVNPSRYPGPKVHAVKLNCTRHRIMKRLGASRPDTAEAVAVAPVMVPTGDDGCGYEETPCYFARDLSVHWILRPALPPDSDGNMVPCLRDDALDHNVIAKSSMRWVNVCYRAVDSEAPQGGDGHGQTKETPAATMDALIAAPSIIVLHKNPSNRVTVEHVALFNTHWDAYHAAGKLPRSTEEWWKWVRLKESLSQKPTAYLVDMMGYEYLTGLPPSQESFQKWQKHYFPPAFQEKKVGDGGNRGGEVLPAPDAEGPRDEGEAAAAEVSAEDVPTETAQTEEEPAKKSSKKKKKKSVKKDQANESSAQDVSAAEGPIDEVPVEEAPVEDVPVTESPREDVSDATDETLHWVTPARSPVRPPADAPTVLISPLASVPAAGPPSPVPVAEEPREEPPLVTATAAYAGASSQNTERVLLHIKQLHEAHSRHIDQIIKRMRDADNKKWADMMQLQKTYTEEARRDRQHVDDTISQFARQNREANHEFTSVMSRMARENEQLTQRAVTSLEDQRVSNEQQSQALVHVVDSLIKLSLTLQNRIDADAEDKRLRMEAERERASRVSSGVDAPPQQPDQPRGLQAPVVPESSAGAQEPRVSHERASALPAQTAEERGPGPNAQLPRTEPRRVGVETRPGYPWRPWTPRGTRDANGSTMGMVSRPDSTEGSRQQAQGTLDVVPEPHSLTRNSPLSREPRSPMRRTSLPQEPPASATGTFAPRESRRPVAGRGPSSSQEPRVGRTSPPSLGGPQGSAPGLSSSRVPRTPQSDPVVRRERFSPIRRPASPELRASDTGPGRVLPQELPAPSTDPGLPEQLISPVRVSVSQGSQPPSAGHPLLQVPQNLIPDHASPEVPMSLSRDTDLPFPQQQRASPADRPWAQNQHAARANPPIIQHQHTPVRDGTWAQEQHPRTIHPPMLLAQQAPPGRQAWGPEQHAHPIHPLMFQAQHAPPGQEARAPEQQAHITNTNLPQDHDANQWWPQEQHAYPTNVYLPHESHMNQHQAREQHVYPANPHFQQQEQYSNLPHTEQQHAPIPNLHVPQGHYATPPWAQGQNYPSAHYDQPRGQHGPMAPMPTPPFFQGPRSHIESRHAPWEPRAFHMHNPSPESPLARRHLSQRPPRPRPGPSSSRQPSGTAFPQSGGPGPPSSQGHPVTLISFPPRGPSSSRQPLSTSLPQPGPSSQAPSSASIPQPGLPSSRQPPPTSLPQLGPPSSPQPSGTAVLRPGPSPRGPSSTALPQQGPSSSQEPFSIGPLAATMEKADGNKGNNVSTVTTEELEKADDRPKKDSDHSRGEVAAPPAATKATSASAGEKAGGNGRGDGKGNEKGNEMGNGKEYDKDSDTGKAADGTPVPAANTASSLQPVDAEKQKHPEASPEEHSEPPPEKHPEPPPEKHPEPPSEKHPESSPEKYPEPSPGKQPGPSPEKQPESSPTKQPEPPPEKRPQPSPGKQLESSPAVVETTGEAKPSEVEGAGETKHDDKGKGKATSDMEAVSQAEKGTENHGWDCNCLLCNPEDAVEKAIEESNPWHIVPIRKRADRTATADQSESQKPASTAAESFQLPSPWDNYDRFAPRNAPDVGTSKGTSSRGISSRGTSNRATSSRSTSSINPRGNRGGCPWTRPTQGGQQTQRPHDPTAFPPLGAQQGQPSTQGRGRGPSRGSTQAARGPRQIQRWEPLPVLSASLVARRVEDIPPLSKADEPQKTETPWKMDYAQTTGEPQETKEAEGFPPLPKAGESRTTDKLQKTDETRKTEDVKDFPPLQKAGESRTTAETQTTDKAQKAKAAGSKKWPKLQFTSKKERMEREEEKKKAEELEREEEKKKAEELERERIKREKARPAWGSVPGPSGPPSGEGSG